MVSSNDARSIDTVVANNNINFAHHGAREDRGYELEVKMSVIFARLCALQSSLFNSITTQTITLLLMG